MGIYIVKRIFQIIVVLFLASLIIFFVVRLTPGDPAVKQLGIRAGDVRYEETLEALRTKWGLDKPIIIQYGIWLGKIVRFDFGISTRSGLPVIDLIKQKMPATIELVLGGVIIGIIFSFIFGVSSALMHKSAWDRTVQVISQVGMAIPVFWLALLMILFFSLKLKILPSSGYVPFLEDPLNNLKHLIMPAMSFGVYEIAVFTRFLRSEILEVKNQDFVKVATSKGLPRRIVIIKYILRNSLIPFVTVLGIELGALIGSTVVIEQIFGWPGIGWLLFNAINNRDYALLQGIIIIIAFIFSFLNLIVDLIYTYLNPRIIYTKQI